MIDLKKRLKEFVFYFCLTYTFFDITGSLVSFFNRTGGGILHDEPSTVQSQTGTNSTSFRITVNLDPIK